MAKLGFFVEVCNICLQKHKKAFAGDWSGKGLACDEMSTT
jgi:hypothetical protein